MTQLEQILVNHKNDFALITDYDYRKNNVSIFDFSKNNQDIASIDTTNPKDFTDYTFGILKEEETQIGIGKYAENRDIYRGKAFTSGDIRSIHLGIDLTMEAYSNIYSPLSGKVHSFQNNAGAGDYGPTIILEHELDGVIFYTLYGHLSEESLDGLYEGRVFEKGEKLCEVGDYPVNGNRFPHLHFQIISDMLGKKGDFFGVTSEKEKDYLLSICPNPNYILQISSL